MVLNSAVLFGGSGFIGIHFTEYLLRNNICDFVTIADIKPPQAHIAHRFISGYMESGKVQYVECDVRSEINVAKIPAQGNVLFVANFAAVHREPGHEVREYYETNMPGAQNVCGFARAIGCNSILFTSSISPYGPSEAVKDENTIPTPETAYGGSKLAAELIHQAWLAEDKANRRLLIVRPGVVFGPGEGGNVSRLIRLVVAKRFVYAGNRDTRKAGIYVKELCNAIWKMHSAQIQANDPLKIVNMTMAPCPSIAEYVDAAKLVSGNKFFIPSIPPWMLLLAARIIGSVFALIGVKTSINIVRVRKLVRSNDIRPSVLLAENYVYLYTLTDAFKDWKQSLPEEWS